MTRGEPVVANRACHCEGGVNGGRTGCVCGAHGMRACHFADADGGISRDTGPLVRLKVDESFGWKSRSDRGVNAGVR